MKYIRGFATSSLLCLDCLSKNIKLLDKKSFWKGVKILSRHKPSIPTLSEHGNVASSNHEKAKMLNDFFSKCFNFSAPPLSFAHRNDLSDVTLTDIDDISYTLEYVEHQLLLLDTSKENGPDSISARMLKETARSIAPSITDIFNLSLRTGCFTLHNLRAPVSD